MISLPNIDAGNKTETDVVRTIAQERPSAKKPEFSKIMQKLEDARPKKQPPPKEAVTQVANKELMNETNDEPDNEQKQANEEAEKKAKMNQLRQQFENVKKEEPTSSQSINVGAVSALKKKFLHIGPPPAEEPAWRKA